MSLTPWTPSGCVSSCRFGPWISLFEIQETQDLGGSLAGHEPSPWAGVSRAPCLAGQGHLHWGGGEYPQEKRVLIPNEGEGKMVDEVFAPQCQMLLLLGFAHPLRCTCPTSWRERAGAGGEARPRAVEQLLPRPAALVLFTWPRQLPRLVRWAAWVLLCVPSAWLCHPGVCESLRGRCSGFPRGRPLFRASPSKAHSWILASQPLSTPLPGGHHRAEARPADALGCACRAVLFL